MKMGGAVVVLTLLVLALSARPAMAIVTDVAFSGVQPPEVEGATLSLPGFQAQPLVSSVCAPDGKDCAESDRAWQIDLDPSLLPGTIGIALINTPAGDIPATFSLDADGGMTITPATIGAEGRAISLIDPAGLETAIGYDELGRVVSLTYSSGQITGLVYDAERVATAVTKSAHGTAALHAYRSGQITGLVYDAERVATTVTEPPAPGETVLPAPLWENILLINPSGAAIRIHYGSDGLITVVHSVPVSVAGWSPLEPMTVGPRSKVGTESLGSKAAESLVNTVISGLFGGGGGGSKRPKTYRDKTKKKGGEPVHISDADTGTEIWTRGKWVKDGLLISNNIAESKDKGTFQTVYLEDETGRRLWPKQIYLYKIWVKHQLTVSWTKSKYVDGALVSQKSGGWTETWVTDLGEFDRLADGESVAMPSIWEQLGYDRAHAGAQSVGTLFKLTPEDMAGMGDVRLVVHITQPKLDPVMTTPFAYRIRSGTAKAPEILGGM